jgi:hypothetical protein
MEITQSFIGENFTRQRIVALEDKILYHHKDLFREMTKEYSYSELSPSITSARLPEYGWSNIGWWLTIPSFLLAIYLIVTGLPNPIAWIAVAGFFFPLLVGYGLRIRKNDLVAFSYKHGPTAFIIKVSAEMESCVRSSLNISSI